MGNLARISGTPLESGKEGNGVGHCLKTVSVQAKGRGRGGGLRREAQTPSTHHPQTPLQKVAPFLRGTPTFAKLYAPLSARQLG